MEALPRRGAARRAFVAGALLLLASGAALWAFDAPTVPYVATALLHAAVGVVWTVLLAWVLVRGMRTGPFWAWGLAAVAWIVSSGAAAFLILRGSLSAHRTVVLLHVAAAVAGAALLLFATRRGATSGAGRIAWTAAAALLVIGGASAASYRAWSARHATRAERIVNPKLPPISMDGEGEGPAGPFFPSSSRTAAGRLIDSSFFLGSEACARCHPDVFEQWNESAHHFSSFNNQWYRKSIEYMQEVAGTKPARWCAGCHDPAPLFSGMMEKPVREILHEPEAQAGLGCTACHAISHVGSTMGQGDYTIRYPELHGLLTSGNRAVQVAHDRMTFLDPAPHRETFLRTFMRVESDRFCSACHKVHLDVPVNRYRWFRGFNEYDAWQNSGVSMNNARAFYHPKEARTCVDCHMPKVASDDPAAKGGLIRSHRFIAANTALPTANNHPDQLRLTQEFLQAGKVSVDVFAVSEAGGGAASAAPGAPGDRLQAMIMAGSEDIAPGAAVHERVAPLRGPFGRAPVRVRRGESVRVEVVVRTRDVGHVFPGGTMDAFDVWLELKATDETGRVLLWSGSVADGGKGPVEPGAHRYHVALIDGHGNPINKRNAWAARALVYARAIPPGAADTVHFRLAVPPDAGQRITLEARVNHRKFAWWNTQFAYAGRRDPTQGPYSVAPDHDDGRWVFDGDTSKVSGAVKSVPDLPITIMASDTRTLEVVPAGAEVSVPVVEDAQDRVRWNDYGIGLLLQGHLKAAEAAFLTVTRIEPGYADGWVNVARCRLEEGNVAGARAVLERALALAPDLAKAHFFMAMADKRDGDYEKALSHLRRASAQFPGDRVVHNEMGRVLFLMRRYKEAVDAFGKTLAIDPEDLTAHYNLMLSHRGLGNVAAAEYSERLYQRFKADEPAQALVGPYLRAHPHDNNERQPIHEHGGVAAPPPPTGPVTGPRVGG
ncbi:MAG TPA: tetratricopeptide repeat protein [Vicinamibacteria bacterium]|nr:tetratricopeptide repeat protein [Vicinamibacteria bacterium]